MKLLCAEIVFRTGSWRRCRREGLNDLKMEKRELRKGVEQHQGIASAWAKTKEMKWRPACGTGPRPQETMKGQYKVNRGHRTPSNN